MGMLKPSKKLNPFSKSKKEPKILMFESEHIQSILESFKKVKLLALEKA